MAVELGNRIREARREAGFTSAEKLAQRIGRSVRTVQRWEHGEVDPSVARLLEIADATGKPIGWFLTEPPVGSVDETERS